MNPLAVSFAASLNFAAMYLVAAFVLKFAVSIMPDHPARDGLAALVL